MAFSKSAVRATSSICPSSLVSTQPSLVLQRRLFSTSLILQNASTTPSSASTTSFTRSNPTQIATTSSTSTTAQSSGSRTGYNALAKAEQKVAKQQKGMARQMPGMSLENQDQPLAGESTPSDWYTGDPCARALLVCDSVALVTHCADIFANGLPRSVHSASAAPGRHIARRWSHTQLEVHVDENETVRTSYNSLVSHSR